MQRNDGVRVGICSVCRKPVHTNPEGWWVACCGVGSHVDTSWNALANPHNVQWRPGYRFVVLQGSKTVARSYRMKPRVYRIRFEIDRDGLLRHTGGPKPTASTLWGVEELYARERPGSNGPPIE